MTSAAIRKALLRWPRARLTGIVPSLSLVSMVCCSPGCWLGSGGPFACRPELGGQRREFGLEAAAGVGAGQAADLYQGAVLAGPVRATRGSPDEDAPAADHEREQQPAQGG